MGEFKVNMVAEVLNAYGEVMGKQELSLAVADGGDLQMAINNLAEVQEVAAQAAAKVTQAAIFLAADAVRQRMRDQQESETRENEGGSAH